MYDPVVADNVIVNIYQRRADGSWAILPNDQPPIYNCDNPVTFRVEVTNNAPVPTPPTAANDNDALNIQIAAAMPAGFTFVSRDPDVASLPLLEPGQSVTQDFSYMAHCDAVSGNFSAAVRFEDRMGTAITKPTKTRNFKVLPGEITVTKVAVARNGAPITPETSEPVANIGDTITWRIRVRSSGLGDVSNVVILDKIDPGLSFTSDTLSQCIVSGGGSECTFNATLDDFGALARIPKDGYVDILTETTINRCRDLRSVAKGTWGCPSEQCAVNADNFAQTGIDLRVPRPLLQYDPPDINITAPYCGVDSQTVSFNVRNIGDGVAVGTLLRAPKLATAPLTITGVTGATYDPATGVFTIGNLPPAPDPGVTISFTAEYAGTTCATAGSGVSGDIDWTPEYYDACDVKFDPPWENSTYQVTANPATTPALAVTKTCTPWSGLMQIRDVEQFIDCTVTITSTEPVGSSASLDLSVVDDYQDEWEFQSMTPVAPTAPVTVTDDGSTLAWTIPNPPAGVTTYAYTQRFRIPSLGESDICTTCGQTWTNSVTVSGRDGCLQSPPDPNSGCPLSASAVVTTHVECPNPQAGVTSARAISGGNWLVCNTTKTFTSTYDFTGPGWDSVNWANNVTFTEDMTNAELFGTPAITVTPSCGVNPPTFTTDTSSGSLVIRATGNGSCTHIGDGARLTIQYDLRPTAPVCGSSLTFLDYATLTIANTGGGASGAFCPAGPSGMTVTEADSLTTLGSAMTVGITGLGTVGPCGTYAPITVTLTKTSQPPAYDAVLFVSDALYEIVGPTATGWDGVQPDSLTGTEVTVGGVHGYAWKYSDKFNAAGTQTAHLYLTVQKRCSDNTNLDAILGYNNFCDDDDPADYDPTLRSCQANASDSGLLRRPSLTVTKFPELIYAEGIKGTPGYTPASWTIRVMNSGAGDAHSVEIVETLGNDLEYLAQPLATEWTDATDVTKTVVSPQEVRYTIQKLAPGEVRLLTFKADIVGCMDTTNTVVAQINCSAAQGSPCQSASDTSTIMFPPTKLVVTTEFIDYNGLCDLKEVIMTARNAGLKPVHNIIFNEDLPPALDYQEGSAEYQIYLDDDSDPITPPPLAVPWTHGAVNTEPDATGAPRYVWSYTNANYDAALQNALTRLDPGDEIQIRFVANVPCSFGPNADQLRFFASYTKCGTSTPEQSGVSVFDLAPNKPVVQIEKRVFSPANRQITCGENIVWEITVRNRDVGSLGDPVAAQYVQLTDTWGDAYSFVGFTDQSGVPINPATYQVSGNSLTWELSNLAPGASFTYHLTTSYSSCTTNIGNTITGRVRCLLPPATVPDGDPATLDPGCDICTPGVDCPTASAETITPLPQLVVTLTNPTVAACAENQQIQIELANTSLEADLYDLDADITLPAGVTYIPGTIQIEAADGTIYTDEPDTSTAGRLRFFDLDRTQHNLPNTAAAAPGISIPRNDSIYIRFDVETECTVSGAFRVQPYYRDCCHADQPYAAVDRTPTWQYPSITLTQTIDPRRYNCGETVDWTITVRNTGTIPAEKVRVSDTYGIGLSFVSLTGVAPTPNPTILHTPADPLVPSDGVIIWEIANLGVNETRTYTLRTTLDAADCSLDANRTNTVNATWYCRQGGADLDPATNDLDCPGQNASPVSNTASVTPIAIANAAISTPAIGYCEPQSGAPVTLTFTTASNSNTLSDLYVDIILPTTAGELAFYAPNPGVSVFTITANPALAPANGLNVTELIPHGSNSYTLRVADSVPPGTTITISFDVTSSCFDTGPIQARFEYDDCCDNHYDYTTDPGLQAETRVDGEDPTLAITVARDVPTPVRGQIVNYTMTVQNAGPGDARYAQIEATLGAWLQYQSIVSVTKPAGTSVSDPACDGATCDDGCVSSPNFNGMLRWEIEDLAVNETVTIVVETLFNPPAPTAPPGCSDAATAFEAAVFYSCPADPIAGGFDNNACTDGSSATCPLAESDRETSTVIGYCSAIGDRVWYDVNGNGIQDAGEVGVGNVTVELYYAGEDGAKGGSGTDADIRIATTTTATDGSGYYWFKNLIPDNYYIRFVPPTDYYVSPQDKTDSNPNPDKRDSDADAVTSSSTYGQTIVTNLAPGEEDLTWDAGLFTPVNIGNLVWHDIDNDGQYEPGNGETGIQGIAVYLQDINGNPVADVNGVPVGPHTTDANGIYLPFSNLRPGQYVVVIPTPPTEYPINSTQPATPADDGVDNNDNGSQPGGTGTAVSSPVITLTSKGEVDTPDDGDGTNGDLTVDFGFFHPVSIGNYVWLDRNADGTQDATELGIPGANVQLEWWNGSTWVGALDINGTPVPTNKLTDASGLYEFLNLPPGDYRVVIPSSNWNAGNVFGTGGAYAGALGSPNQGGDDGVDGTDPDQSTNLDDNGDNDGVLARTNGVFSTRIQLRSGQEPLNDGDTNPAHHDSSSDYTIDFGFYQPVSIGNYIWYDANGNGLQDSGEHGIQDAIVRLFQSDGTSSVTNIYGNTVNQITTPASGVYTFGDLPPGRYVVEVIPPATYYQPTTGVANVNNDDNTDSNGVLTGGRILSSIVDLFSRTEPPYTGATDGDADTNSNLTVDFGFVRYDYGDLPDNIANYPDYATLKASPGTGAYHLIDEKTYLGNGVDAETDGQPHLAALGDDSAGPLTDDEDGVEFLTPIMPGVDATIRVTAGSAGVLNAWIDLNGDGDFDDDGERIATNDAFTGPGYHDFTIAGTDIATTGVATSIYSRFRFTAEENQGGNSPTGLATSGEVEDYVLMSLGDFVWRDNGGGNVTNGNNGRVDAGETGIAGVTVQLYRKTASGDVLWGEMDTDTDGRYLFTGLEPGQYFVHIPKENFDETTDPLYLHFSTIGNEGDGDLNETVTTGNSDNGIDSGTPWTTGISSAIITLAFGDEPTNDGDADANSNRAIDFGFYRPVALGNFVWDDNGAGTGGIPNDGKVNGDEKGIPGVMVELYAEGATPGVTPPIATTVTGGDGFYLFDMLVEGRYFVHIPQSQFAGGAVLEDYISSLPQGGDTANDDNVDENGQNNANPASGGISSTIIDLQAGNEPAGETGQGGHNRYVNTFGGALTDASVNLTVDFGLLQPVSIGNRVWLDLNGDGIQDGGSEIGIPGVVVQLWYNDPVSGWIPAKDLTGATLPDSSGFSLGNATLQTDSNGQYQFTNLLPGEYQVWILRDNWTNSNLPFAPGQLYEGAVGSPRNGGDNWNDTDDNGNNDGTVARTGGVQSSVIDLRADLEPTSEDGDGDSDTDLTIDFGFFQPVSIGNFVWLDANANGQWDTTGELPIEGVSVQLFTAAGNPVVDVDGNTVAAVDTDANGLYNFINLRPGTYYVQIPALNWAQAGKPFSSTGLYAGVYGSPGQIADSMNDPDNNRDHGDHDGILAVNTGVRSVDITLTSRGEPVGEDNQDDDGINVSGVPNSSDLRVDFGFYTPVNLGNLVWHDLNNDGQYEPGDGETGIDNIRVQLFRSGDDPTTATPVDEMLTGSGGLGTGEYLFTGLTPGEYFVYIPNPPAAYPLSSTPTETSDNGVDNDDNGTQTTSGQPVQSPNITLTSRGEPGDTGNTDSDLTIDFGFFAPASFGDFVWEDRDADGIQDLGEPGIEGVTVTLYDQAGNQVTIDADGNSMSPTTTTDSNGHYEFTNLFPGQYYVVFNVSTATQIDGTPINPAHLRPTDQDAESDDLLDSDANVTTGRTITTTLISGENDLSWDAGFYQVVSLGDLVWFDANNNGVFDGSETGIENVTVELYKVDALGNATFVTSTDTNSAGRYVFTDLKPGDYYVHIPAAEFVSGELAGYWSTIPTTADPDNNVNEDADENGVNNGDPTLNGVSSGVITLRPDIEAEPTGEDVTNIDPDTVTPDNRSNLTVDFGFFQPVSVGNYVWFDRNASGRQDQYDSDGDGTPDTDEIGIPGVVVQLLYHDPVSGNWIAARDVTGAPLPDNSGLALGSATLTTDSNGYYNFTNLPPGEYQVTVLADNWTNSSLPFATGNVYPGAFGSPGNGATTGVSGDVTAAANTDDNGDHDDAAALNTGVTSLPIWLTSAQEPTGEDTQDGNDPNSELSIDFGFYVPVSIGNLVWHDANNNGVYEPGLGESGINGVTVQLFPAGADPTNPVNLIAQMNTGDGLGTGEYKFTGLRPGDYFVYIPTPPTDYPVSSTTTATTDNGVNNDDNGDQLLGSGQPVRSPDISLTYQGETTNDDDDSTPDDANTDLTIDFGFFAPVSLGNRVWQDIDADGTQGGTEPGIDDVVVKLWRKNDTTGILEDATQWDGTPVNDETTAGGGYYNFTNLSPGVYVVEVLPSNWADGAPLGRVTTGALADQHGRALGSPGFGATEGASGNANAANNRDDNGDKNGVTAYSDPAIGVCSGEITLTSHGEPTLEDSEENSADNNSDLSIDFGFYYPVRVGDVVWFDENADGIQNDSTPVDLSGIEVRLYDSAGTQIKHDVDGNEFGTGGVITTGADGAYVFDNLPPNTAYYVVFNLDTLPDGYAISPQNQGNQPTDDDIDSDADLTTGQTGTTGILRSNDKDLTLDMGIVRVVSLGDYLWHDVDGDGQQGATTDEPPMDGWTVELFVWDGTNLTQADDIYGNPVASQTTGAAGKYFFINLPPDQEYVVRVTPSAADANKGFVPTIGSVADGAVRDPDDETGLFITDSNARIVTGETYFQSDPVLLTWNGEPTGDGDTKNDPHSNRTVDFGFVKPVSVGNYIWFDQDYDGVQDTSEPGINGVTVQLWKWVNDAWTDTFITTDNLTPQTHTTTTQTVSGKDGVYLFDNLFPGTYYIQVVASNWADDTGALGAKTDGSRPAVWGTVGNGPADNYSGTAYRTDDNGDLEGPTADYTNGVVSQDIILKSEQEPTGEDTPDTNGNNSDLSIDFGFFFPSSLGDRVWFDENGDGIQGDPTDEPGIGNVNVLLFDAVTGQQVKQDVLGNVFGTSGVITTDASGNYLFENLPPGSYYVKFDLANSTNVTIEGELSPLPDELKNKLVATVKDAPGSNETNDSDATKEALGLYHSDATTPALNWGSHDETLDGGFYLPVSVGNRVWFDIDADGVQMYDSDGDGTLDAYEPGIQGVTLRLERSNDGGNTWETNFINADGNPVSNVTQTTDANGYYLFGNLIPGDYRVVVLAENWTDDNKPFGADGKYPGAFGSPGSGVTTGFSGDETNAVNIDDNGDHDGAAAVDTGVASELINLISRSEPVGEDLQDGDDNSSELSIDFGFYIHDFGDLPDSYGTLRDSDGARHAIDGVTYLGRRVDEELTGVPTPTALGDDNNPGRQDDEDGVAFLTPIMPSLPGQPFTYQIKITASADGYLNAWIDFDGLGFGAGDKITSDNLFLTKDEHTLTFTAPESATPFATTLYSRFRFTKNADDGGVNPTGLAHSGEVEDYALGSLGSRLWRDNGAGGGGNNNGVQDGSEPGLPGAIVELYQDKDGDGKPDGAAIATTVTDDNGDYRFTGLPDGTYVVYLPPSNFASGGALENLYSSSGNQNPNVDHQDQMDTGLDDDYPYQNGIYSPPIMLALGTQPINEAEDIGQPDANSNLTVDFGFIRLDFGDLPDKYSTSMSANGPRHVIDDVTFLGAGVDAESDGKPTITARGDDLTYTDDEDGVTFLTPIMPGQPFTIEVVSSVDDTYLNAWIDFNGDGDFNDAGEHLELASLPGVTEHQLVSDVNTLTFIAPSSSLPFASTLYARFRLTDNAGEATTPTGEAPNGEVEDYALLSLGNRVWFDDGAGGGKPDDGKQNGGEKGAAGVKVELYRAGQRPGVDAPIATTTTDAKGNYLFTGLSEGDYFVHIPASEFVGKKPLAGYVSSLGSGLPNSDRDQNADENGVDTPNLTTRGISSGIVTLTLGGEPTAEDGDANSNLTIDFGFTKLAALGDYVWLDHNRNGVQDAGEPGVPNVTVTLYKSDGTVIGTTTTDANGYYRFDNLRPGTYYLEFTLPPGYQFSSQNSGGNNGGDSDADAATGRTVMITLGSGQVDLTWDAGVIIPVVPTPTPVPAVTPTPMPGMTPTPGMPDVGALRIEKSVNTASAQAGDLLMYSILVTNPTDAPATNVSVHDILPQGLTYIADSASIDGVQLSGVRSENGQLDFVIPAIPANGSVTLTYTVTVQSGIGAGQYANIAEIVGGAQDDAVVHVGSEGSRRGDIIGKRREDIIDIKPCTVIPAELEKPWFITDIAMYAASELFDTSSPFIHWSEANGLTIDRQLLSPTGVREFGAEILKFSQDNISTVMMNSGIGLHLKYAPLIVAGANAKGVSPETYLEERLRQYAQQSNLKVVPRNIFPIFLEYAEGDPRYVNVVDINNWATLLWDVQSFDTNIIPSAIGQALRRQVLLLGDALATNHDVEGARNDNGQFAGVDDARGFIGLLAADSVANKLYVMANILLQTAETSSGETVRYFPYRTHVDAATLANAQPDVSVVNAESRLFDQLSLLWALSDVMLLMEQPGAAQQAFSGNLLAPDVDWAALPQTFDIKMTDVSPATLHAMAARLAEIVFATIERFHYDQNTGLLRDTATIHGEQSDEHLRVSTTSSALALAAFARYHAAMRHDAAAQAQIAALIRSAADALMATLYDREKGGMFAGTRQTDDQTKRNDDREKTLSAQMTGIRGLLAAYDITRDARYRDAAFALDDFAEKALWNDDFAVYKDREDRGLYKYTPYDLGATVGALRELIYHAETTAQTLEITERMKSFVKQIAKHAGLQLSEVMTGGEQYLMPVDQVSAIRAAQSLESPFGLAPVLGSEIRLNRDAITALREKRPTDSCEQAQSSMRSVYYLTDIGMYAASEFSLNAKPLARASGTEESEQFGERNRNPELLNLGALERTAQKAADFSDENLAHIQSKSGLGVALTYAPLIQELAKKQGIAPEKVVEALLAQYAELSGLNTIPEGLLPIFIEFEGGVPEIEYGKETERWLDSGMDRSITPSALGQTLRRQVLWLKAALSARHDDANRIAASGEFIGRNAEEGFLGLLIAQETANKIVFLYNTMRTPIAGEKGTYFPHRLEIEFDGDAPKAYRVVDSDSVLFDQMSLLWGISEFYGMLKAKDGAPYSELFGKDQLISGKYEDMARELTGLLLKNLARFHWNATYGTFYETHSMETAKGNAPQEQVISTQQIAMSAIALESVIRNFGADSKLAKQAASLLSAQVDFLYRSLYRAEDGAMFNGASLTQDEAKPFDGLKTLVAHSAAVRSFLIAYRLTTNEQYLAAATRVFEFLDRTFWDTRLEVYKSAIGQYQYTPLNVAMTVGAFRELLAVDQAAFIERMSEHFAKFFDSVVARIGLQLSEQQYFLELAVEPKTLAPVFASDLLIQPVGSAADMNIPQAGATLRYVISVPEANLPCDSNDAYIEDTLPENVSFERSMPAPVSVNDRVVKWRVGDLAPDRDDIYRITVDVRVNAPSMMGLLGLDQSNAGAGWRDDSLKNCASFQCSGQAGDVPLDSACVEDHISKPQLGIEKSLRSVVAEPGKEAEFELVVTNLSDVTAYRLVVEDQNPEGFVYLPDSVKSSEVTDIQIDDTNPLVWVLEDLKPGKRISLTYRVILNTNLEAGSYASQVKVHALDRSGFPFESNEFEFTIDVQRGAVLQVSQQLGEQQAAAMPAGQPTPLITTIENVGTDGVLDASVALTLPDEIVDAPQTSRLNGVAIGEPERKGKTLIWKIGELPPGVTKTLQSSIIGNVAGKFAISTIIRGATERNASYESRTYDLTVNVE